MLATHHKQQLLTLARDAIHHRLHHDSDLPLDEDNWPAELTQPAACFVTLELEDKLRGCIGTLETNQSLLLNVCQNATGAAFRDPRFPRLDRAEFEHSRLSISVLGAATALKFHSTKALASLLRPEVDGLILEAGERHALFLPQVWKLLPDPAEFIRQLKLKAGLAENAEPPDLTASRFEVEYFQETRT